MLVFGEADAKMGAMHTDFTRGDTCREMKADRELERAGRVPGTETGRPRAQGCWKGWKEGAWGGTGETLSLLLRSSSRPGLPSREEDTHGPGAKPGLGRGLLLRSLGRSSGARGNPGRAITGFPPHTSRRESVSTVAGKLGVGGSVPENSPAEAAPTSFPASRRTTWSSFHQKPKHTYPLVRGEEVTHLRVHPSLSKVLSARRPGVAHAAIGGAVVLRPSGAAGPGVWGRSSVDVVQVQ